MTVITMSRTEIDRMGVLHDLAEDRIKVAEASTLMGLGRRQVFRLAKAYRQHGPAALVSSRRGKRSNRSYPTAFGPRSLASFGIVIPTLGRRLRRRSSRSCMGSVLRARRSGNG